MKYTIEIFPEICCDECNDISHNHMTCPICKDDYAGTDIYHGIYEDPNCLEETITCEECDTTFKLLSYYCGDAEVELIEEGK